MPPLVQSGPDSIQSFPFKKGYMRLEATDPVTPITGQRLCRCRTLNGAITITFKDETTEDIIMDEMEVGSIPDSVESITIISGTFDFA